MDPPAAAGTAAGLQIRFRGYLRRRGWRHAGGRDTEETHAETDGRLKPERQALDRTGEGRGGKDTLAVLATADDRRKPRRPRVALGRAEPAEPLGRRVEELDLGRLARLEQGERRVGGQRLGGPPRQAARRRHGEGRAAQLALQETECLGLP